MSPGPQFETSLPRYPGGAKVFLLLSGKLLLAFVALGIAYIAYVLIYNLYFHPLRSFPGPKLWAMTRLPYTCNELSGQPHRGILELHQTYGHFVRIAPEILCISHLDAAPDLKGHRKAGKKEHGKDPIAQFSTRHNIIGANRADHARFRQSLAHGFSAQAMLEQQPTIRKYINTLFQRLHEMSAAGSKPVDMAAWFNYTTFDVIGDLAFGEPFGCLEDSSYHPWVQLIFSNIKFMAVVRNFLRYPFAGLWRKLWLPKDLIIKNQEHEELSKMKVRKRLATESDRPDFIGKMVCGRDGKGNMTFEELASNASVLIIAGSETTATLLSAATFYLGRNQNALAKLTEEVRAAYASEDDIDMVSTQSLKYLQAVLEESLRIYPPVAAGQPRLITPGGDTIAGRFVPGKTIVEIPQWATYHNPMFFKKPDDFIPERWLGDAKFADDKREVMQPFSVGPRNCIGRNLAYAEMRLIMARMVWNFDLHLHDDSKDWADQSKLYILWDKGPLNVYLIPRSK
ncbi:hypothetical protein KJ359_010386 [Pestalotiopsis sp. 9143b]|nr:hypothetical protein KJ359_010386 [Pestalotiopsis sp. 9143b]